MEVFFRKLLFIVTSIVGGIFNFTFLLTQNYCTYNVIERKSFCLRIECVDTS